MMNYLWAGLLLAGFGFAIVLDVADEARDIYRNGEPLVLQLGPGSAGSTRLEISVDGERYLDARLLETADADQLLVPIAQDLPARWRRVAEHQGLDQDGELRLTVLSREEGAATLTASLPPIHLPRLRAMAAEGFEMAEFAVTLALGLAGLMALWLGLMRIAELSGLIAVVVRAVRPLMGWLFPDVPRDHPALGSISMNLAANVLGLGNAATPLGIRAMQQLQELNDQRKEASDAMCMFLALNTSSVQLVPPVTIVALLGVGVATLLPAILLATLVSTAVAITAARFYARRSGGSGR